MKSIYMKMAFSSLSLANQICEIRTRANSAGVICRTPNAECTTQNAERRTPNAEFQSAVYRVKHVLSVNMAAIEIINISDK